MKAYTYFQEEIKTNLTVYSEFPLWEIYKGKEDESSKVLIASFLQDDLFTWADIHYMCLLYLQKQDENSHNQRELTG